MTERTRDISDGQISNHETEDHTYQSFVDAIITSAAFSAIWGVDSDVKQ
jgi:hypothetical protein